MNIESSQSAIELARIGKHFFGYGRLDAPFWFIGPEAGMAREGDSLTSRYESWKALEFRPLVDCAAHHRGFGFTKWHQQHPPKQQTWRQLIRLLLTYKCKPNDIENIREYQRDHWGNATGETCVIELSGLASPSMRTPQDRSSYLHERMARIRQEIQAHPPELIVMYGVGQQKEWEQISGQKFDANGMCRIGRTVAAVALHPVTTGLGNDYWIALGNSLRLFRKSAENG